ncbi:MAG: RecQ family ATP-dependent DNA helicase [Methylococcales bacterium]|nr:RecQ family ATP-dependent DNA helicase [Methylococcales bacterium]
MDWTAPPLAYCSLDLETNKNGEIFALGAVFNDKTLHRKAPFTVATVLAELDSFAQEADFMLGHNLLQHDLPLCRAINPRLKLLDKPVIDTLLLSPLAFPENPYHHLVKDYKLVKDSLNDPLADARLTASLLHEQLQALQAQHHDGLLSFYHYAFSGNPQYQGIQQVFRALGAEAIKASKAFDYFKQLSTGRVCASAFTQVVLRYLPDANKRVALAYCLAWLRVAGGNSIIPPWVRLHFPEVAPILSQLRDIPCQQPGCGYCVQTHNPISQLQRYFGFPAFRPLPADAHGGSLQQAIVQAAMADKPVFAILPTSGGKSLCFQLPALVRYQRRGLLTIVISPLQALMKDQVDNLRNKTGAPNAAALNGLLTAPERGAVLQAVQLGDIAILYVSPEQLRNAGFKNAISHREIGAWVFDEAHCLSKWGHDFRPDYVYAGRFIKEFAQQQNAVLPPVQCFTATAKQDVQDEILDYFRANLGQSLNVFAGGVERRNLNFEVQTANKADKYANINRLLLERLDKTAGSAIIYCATRAHTEELAEFLQGQQWDVEAFHAGKDSAEKRHIQENFITGTTRIITATNAFGMGIDKDNVRLVIHADIPGSLENYLQEAGRAGRDQQEADCVLLFDAPDIETQFKMSAMSQLNQKDIAQLLRALRLGKKDPLGNVIVTTGELLRDDHIDLSFEHDAPNAATKVITAVSWLEKSGFIERNENRTQVFQGKPLVKSLPEAEQKIAQLNLSKHQQARWLAIVAALLNADKDEGFSADSLAELGEFADTEAERADPKHRQTASQRVIRTLQDMAERGLIQKNLLLTAYLRYKVADASTSRLSKICSLERAMLQLLQEYAPDADSGQWQALSLRALNQQLLDGGQPDSNPELLRGLLISLAEDGRGLAAQKGSLTVRYRGQDHYGIKLNRDWQTVIRISERRQAYAAIVLAGIIARIPEGTPASADVLVEFSDSDLLAALKADLIAAAELKDPLAAMERALNFLHEQRVITLQKGLAVFRQAMTVHILPEAKGRRYSKGDFEPLAQHYSERVFQIHVINEYARLALEKISHALHFVGAYFGQDKGEFVKRYFAERKDILERATSQQSFQRIVGDLNNAQQTTLVASDEHDNLLILAGPGSGKTRVVVHRCAYLLRVKRVPAAAILVLCFNRNAVTELRKRLTDLVGDDAKGVLVQTYHGLSLRLTGHALNHSDHNTVQLDALIPEAIQLLKGEKPILGFAADEIRDRLLAPYRYILVDEYQDIDDDQYQLVSALAGRTLEEEQKLTILAVGDDDQNIYTFRGANIGFIRQFKDDYRATEHYLVENYRSSAHIIAAANALIAHNQDRMKTQHPIRINSGRKNLPSGGRWQQLDPLAQGRVQIIRCANEAAQASAVLEEVLRLRQLDSTLEWSQCAILTTQWQLLSPVRALLEANNIPLSLMIAADKQAPLSRIREYAQFLAALKQQPNHTGRASDHIAAVIRQLQEHPDNPWLAQLLDSLLDWQKETGDHAVPHQQTLAFFYETFGEQRKDRRLGNGVLLATIHAVKGMEFNHVIILAGGFSHSEEQRRLLYVGMTRAQETLCLSQRLDAHHPFIAELDGDFVLRRDAPVPDPSALTPLSQHYACLGMGDYYLDFAALFPAQHRIHATLAALQPGSLLTASLNNGKLELQADGISVARLSHEAQQTWQPLLARTRRIKVIAMVVRNRDDSQTDYQARCRVETWEIPMVEWVYG